MRIDEKPELLSPAGSMEALEAALRYGADAVYLGGSFLQLRAASAGFSDAALAEAVGKAHALGRRVYVTVNCLAKNSEIPPLGDYFRFLRDAGADGAIISDLGAMRVLRASAPELPMIVSTQASCMNYSAADAYAELGAKRIVLARELTLPEIAELREKAPAGLRLEAFVHGAMCIAYSGRCLLSAYLTGRSGNRGECAQACRWSYHLVEEKRPDESFPILEDERGSAILSSKDLCCLPFLDELAAAGVSSYKIEGRMKSPYYIAAVTNAYRCAIDRAAPTEALLRELDCVSHRPYCDGFYHGRPTEPCCYDERQYLRACTFVGTAARDACGGRLRVLTRNFFREGDTLEALTPGMPGRAFRAAGLADAKGEKLACSNHPMQEVELDCPLEVRAGDMIRSVGAPHGEGA